LQRDASELAGHLAFNKMPDWLDKERFEIWQRFADAQCDLRQLVDQLEAGTTDFEGGEG